MAKQEGCSSERQGNIRYATGVEPSAVESLCDLRWVQTATRIIKQVT